MELATYKANVEKPLAEHRRPTLDEIEEKGSVRTFKRGETAEYLTRRLARDNPDIALVKKGAEILGDDTAIVLFRNAVKGKLRAGPGGDFTSEEAREHRAEAPSSPIKRGSNSNEYWQSVIQRDRPDLLPEIGVTGSA